MSGTAMLHQIYLDGVAQLRTRGVYDAEPDDLKQSSGRVVGHPGMGAPVRLALRNIGDFDMAVTRIRPLSAPAKWMRIGLDPMPTRYGGKDRPPKGGDTAGFFAGGPLYSVIPPHDPSQTPGLAPPGEYSRAIDWTAPPGTAPGSYDAKVVVGGNFPTIAVTFSFEVVKAVPDTPPGG